MKNLTIKKVALGLFLAGYAASGAFAAQSATTGATIIGNAPVIKQAGSATAGFTYKITRSGTDISTLTAPNNKVRVGDVIEVKFDYSDVDGDEADNFIAPAGTGNATSKFEFFVWDGTAKVSGVSGTPTVGTAAVIGTQGVYTWTIPADAAGAGNSIGIELKALSKFGDPRVGASHSANNVFGAPGAGGTPPPTGPVLPSTTTMGVHIIKDTTTSVYGKSQSTVQTGYTAATVSPKLGETFKVEAFDKNDGTGAALTATDYTIQWYATSGNSAAGGSAATTDIILAGATGDTLALPTTNSAAITSWGLPATTEAGVQGFKIKVELN